MKTIKQIKEAISKNESISSREKDAIALYNLKKRFDLSTTKISNIQKIEISGAYALIYLGSFENDIITNFTKCIFCDGITKEAIHFNSLADCKLYAKRNNIK
jgi:uncharacterized protein (DUF2344 family)